MYFFSSEQVMYTQWMVIKGMVFVLVTLNHFSSCSRTSSNSMTQVDTSSLNEGVGRKELFFSVSEKEGEKKKRNENEEENFTESMTPLNQLRMNEEQVCPFLLLPLSLSLFFLFVFLLLSLSLFPFVRVLVCVLCFFRTNELSSTFSHVL